MPYLDDDEKAKEERNTKRRPQSSSLGYVLTLGTAVCLIVSVLYWFFNR